MTPQKQLERFYNTLRGRAPADHGRFSWLLGPDLIRLDDQYLNSRPRIAIIGQEVREWYYTYPQFIVGKWDYCYTSPERSSVQKAIDEYGGFDFGFSPEKPLRHTPFWRFFHEVRESAFPGECDAHKKILWTNLVKFSHRVAACLKCHTVKRRKPSSFKTTF